MVRPDRSVEFEHELAVPDGAVHAMLDSEENAMTPTQTRVTVASAGLAAAVDAVRFAVSCDSGLPVLCGALIEVESNAMRSLRMQPSDGCQVS